MGVFAQYAADYADVGLPAFPVNTRDKKPAVKGWQKTTPRRSRAWARGRLGASDGLGIVMGKPSGITEIDVDAVGEAWIGAAVEQFGETPIIIRTASGKGKLWYRHNGEGRRIRPFQGLPVDILGAGFTVAPPSWREDLAASYAFRSGGLADLANLTTIPCEAQGALSVQTGERNVSLWRWCMAEARHCDDVEALIDAAETWVSAFPDPLPRAEVQKCARSAMRYEVSGRNYLGLKRPQLTRGDQIMDDLIDQPDAFALYHMFTRWHHNRPSFAIAPRAMSKASNPPWHFTRIERARDILLERGFIEEITPPRKGRNPGKYRLKAQTSDSVHNHYTPFSPGGCGGPRQ